MQYSGCQAQNEYYINILSNNQKKVSFSYLYQWLSAKADSFFFIRSC